jgi:hypothetical protein
LQKRELNKKVNNKLRIIVVLIFINLEDNIAPPPPLHTVYVYKVYLFAKGSGEGGELNQREGYKGNSSQS